MKRLRSSEMLSAPEETTSQHGLDTLVPDIQKIIFVDLLDPASRASFALTSRSNSSFLDRNFYSYQFPISCARSGHVGLVEWCFKLGLSDDFRAKLEALCPTFSKLQTKEAFERLNQYLRALTNSEKSGPVVVDYDMVLDMIMDFETFPEEIVASGLTKSQKEALVYETDLLGQVGQQFETANFGEPAKSLRQGRVFFDLFFNQLGKRGRDYILDMRGDEANISHLILFGSIDIIRMVEETGVVIIKNLLNTYFSRTWSLNMEIGGGPGNIFYPEALRVMAYLKDKGYTLSEKTLKKCIPQFSSYLADLLVGETPPADLELGRKLFSDEIFKIEYRTDLCKKLFQKISEKKCSIFDYLEACEKIISGMGVNEEDFAAIEGAATDALFSLNGFAIDAVATFLENTKKKVNKNLPNGKQGTPDSNQGSDDENEDDEAFEDDFDDEDDEGEDD